MRQFGELEDVIMDRLWEWGRPALVREVVDDLGRDRSIAYTTVMTVMENLHRKGWLRRQRDGRAWRYEPTGSRSGYTAALMSEALATNPDRRTALAHFVLQMSPHDAALLREALEATQPPSAPQAATGQPRRRRRPPKAGSDDRRGRPAGLRRLAPARWAPGCWPGPAGRTGRRCSAIVTYLAAAWSVVAAAGLAGLALAVHATALGSGLSQLIGACVIRLRDTYATPGGALVACLGLALAGAVAARTAVAAATHLRAVRLARAAATRGPSGWSGGRSRTWAPCWSSIRSRSPTAWRGPDPAVIVTTAALRGPGPRPAGRRARPRAGAPRVAPPPARGPGPDRPPAAAVPAAHAGDRRAGRPAGGTARRRHGDRRPTTPGPWPPPWSCWPRSGGLARTRPDWLSAGLGAAGLGDGGRRTGAGWPARCSGCVRPAEPLGRLRRQLLRAGAAGLALTPLLLALTPALVALALGRVPVA